jgi:hypothetical protein
MVTETAGGVSLTDVEQALVDHVTRGELLDLAGAEPVDEAAMRSLDSPRTVRAAVLRDILRGRLAPDPDPHGLRLRGARIAGPLDLENLTTGVGVELYDCLLSEGLVARNATLPFLVLSGCRLEHPAQPPLAADRLTATVLFLDRAVITADCKAGAVRLPGAHLGRLECDGATIRNDTGPALHADNLRVDQSVFLSGGFQAIGTSEAGAVRLLGAHLGSQLDCIGATIRNDTGPALAADSLQVDLDVILSGGFEAVGAGSGVTLNLRQVRVGGVLEFAPARLEHTADPQARLALDGLTYAGLPVGIASRDWLRLLREATKSYAAQPYQQFAGAHRAAGHDGEVRRILMAQRQDQLDRGALTGRAERAWARLTKLTLGYGYQPWRALLALLAVVTIAVLLALGRASLTDVERALVAHVTRGELLDLAAAEPVDEAAMRTWDSARTIRAAVLRDILRGRLAPDPDPHGLRLRGARIAGPLDLENLTTSVGVELHDCLLGEGLVARDAKLPFLVLSGCRLGRPAQPPLDADRLTATRLVLDRAVITADCEMGAVRLIDAHVGSQLDCTDATMRNDAGPALAADSLQVDQDVFLRGLEAVGASQAGAVRLFGAHLYGQLDCTGATMRNDAGPALHAESLQADQGVFLHNGFEAIGAGELGAVRLVGAHVGGSLDCTDATMRNDAGPALHADRLRADQSVFLSGDFQAVGTSEDGVVRLLGAYVRGQLDCTGAKMRNDAGPALAADSLQADQGVFLHSGSRRSVLVSLARCDWSAPTSAAHWTAPTRRCATASAPPCSPRTYRPTRTSSFPADSRRSAEVATRPSTCGKRGSAVRWNLRRRGWSIPLTLRLGLPWTG